MYYNVYSVGKKFLEERISQLHLKEKQRLAKDKIRETLANTEDLQPGTVSMSCDYMTTPCDYLTTSCDYMYMTL